MKRTYDSTVARIAGNLLSGIVLPSAKSGGGFRDYGTEDRLDYAKRAVLMARAIVAEVQRTEPVEPQERTAGR